MRPSLSRGKRSVSRRSGSTSYATTAGLPSSAVSSRPRSGSGSALPALYSLFTTRSAQSIRVATEFFSSFFYLADTLTLRA